MDPCVVRLAAMLQATARSLVGWLLLVSLWTTAAGCAGTQTPPDRIDRAPDDFAVAVTVHGPETARADIDALPRAYRPARYIVEPDRVLRASLGPGADAQTFPPQTRRLDDRAMQQLWRLVRDGRLLADGHPGLVETSLVGAAPPNRRTTEVFLSYGETRRYLRVFTDRDTEFAAAAVELAERLGDLAWVPE